MNKIFTLTLSAAAAILPLCAEAAEFEIPDPFTLVMVDSDDKAPAVKSGAETVTLPAGPHQLVMRVEGTFRYHTDSRYLAGQPVDIEFVCTQGTKNRVIKAGKKYTGKAIFNDFSLKAENKQNVTHTIQFQGTGELKQVTATAGTDTAAASSGSGK